MLGYLSLPVIVTPRVWLQSSTNFKGHQWLLGALGPPAHPVHQQKTLERHKPPTGKSLKIVIKARERRDTQEPSHSQHRSHMGLQERSRSRDVP